MSPVVIFNTFNIAEADLLRSRLEAAGFHSEVKGALAALSMDGYSMATGGISIVVPEEEAAEARAFIASQNQSPDE